MSRLTRLAGLLPTVIAATLVGPPWLGPVSAADPAAPPAGSSAAAGEDLQVEVTKRGLGKEVSIRKGDKEWYMLIEVTQDNTVVIRQEKDHDTYIVDASETHDREMTKGEIDAAIEAFINSVQTQVKKR